MKATFIIGEVCSGKDTFANKNKGELLHIDLGNLVREKFNTENRIFDNSLDEYLTQKVAEKLNEEDVIITGFRQVSLCKKIEQLFDEVQYIYLVVPRNILKQRFAQRVAKKDSLLTFEQCIEGDIKLGMTQLQHYLLTEVECNFIKSY